MKLTCTVQKQWKRIVFENQTDIHYHLGVTPKSSLYGTR